MSDEFDDLMASADAHLNAADQIETLQARVRDLAAKLAMPCGSCHPCTEWANETWIREGERLPTVFAWRDMRTALQRAEQALERVRKLADQWATFGVPMMSRPVVVQLIRLAIDGDGDTDG